VGNGKFYGGSFPLLPAADLTDGQLDVCLIPRLDGRTLWHTLPAFLTRQRLSERVVERFQAGRFELTCERPMGFELDGEWIGHLPATFAMDSRRLRVVVP
jgi:diacylglycerol kinase (ATP)